MKFSKEDGGVQEKASWSMFVREIELLATGHDGNGDVLYRCSEAFWSFVMCFGKGDMQVICQAWGLPGYHEADEVSGWCLGNRSTLPHTDCRTNAGWRATSDLPNDLFVARVRERSDHPLNRSPFFNRYFPRGDNLHVWDHHGILSIIAGSFLHRLTRTESRLGSTVDKRLDAINLLMDDFYSRHPVSARLPSIRDSNLVDSTGWCTLHGSVVKAANSRHLHGFLAELANRFCDSKVAPLCIEHASIRKVCSSLDGFYKLMYSSGMFMTNQQVRELKTYVDRIGRHMQLLRSIAEEANLRYYQITPNVHYGMHWPEQAQLINPRFVQCYGDESLIGRMTEIWEASCNGPFVNTQQKVVAFKWLTFFALTLDL